MNRRTKETGAERSRVKAPKEHTDCPALRLENAVLGLLFFAVALSFSPRLLVNFTLPKLVALRMCVLLLVTVWIYRICKGEVRILPRTISYAGIALGLWWIFTTFFALDVRTAIHGVYGRYNGLFTHGVWLLLFFVIASTPMDVTRAEKILKIFITALIPVALYAIFQFFGLDPVAWTMLEGRSSSTIGHPVSLTALLGLALPFVITFSFQKRGVGTRLYWASLALLFLFAAVTAVSRGPLIGIIAAGSLVLIFNIRRLTGAWRKQFMVALLFTLVVIGVVVSLSAGKGGLFERVKSTGEIRTRLLYYKIALNIIEDHPLVGVGFENFRTIYPQYRLAEENRMAKDVEPTMVHDGYLQAALTNGIPALLIYLVFLVSISVFLLKGFRHETDVRYRSLAVAFAASIGGYLIQDLTGWLEISLTTFFWIILGVTVSFSITDRDTAPAPGIKRTHGYLLSCACLLCLLFLSGDALRRVYVDRLFFNSRVNHSANWSEVEADVLKGIEAARGDFQYEDMAGTIYVERFIVTGEESIYRKALALYQRARSDNPFDAYVLIHMAELDTLALRKGVILKPDPATESAAARLLQMDENNTSVYETLACLRMAENRMPEALTFLERAKALGSLKHRYLLIEADLYAEVKDYPRAMNTYKEVISLSEQQKDYSEEWLKAKYGYAFSLMQAKHYAKALEELGDLVARVPGDPLLYVTRGNVYASMNDVEKAQSEFAAALKIDPQNPLARKGYQACEEHLRRKEPR